MTESRPSDLAILRGFLLTNGSGVAGLLLLCTGCTGEFAPFVIGVFLVGIFVHGWTKAIGYSALPWE